METMEAAFELNILRSVPTPQPMSLREAIDYALTCRGSGVRQALAGAVGRACGMRAADADALAGAIESFHHASLILDDLPCMDDAVERRGRACLHRAAGEDQAILAALALINQGYTECWRVAVNYPLRTGMAAKLVAACMGERGILDGQSRDLHYAPGCGAAEVRTIAVQKTGMLLKLALVLPAVMGGASRSTLLELSRLAKVWGRLYQGIDDFSDLLLSGESTGKTAFRDLSQARPNLVVALGLKPASVELATLEERAGMLCEAFAQQGEVWSMLQQFHAQLGEKTARIRVAMEAA
jgi:geranylgeranyl pyrophosphate synthase